MVVAPKKDYYTQPQQQEQQEKVQRNKKRKKTYRLEKILLGFSVSIVLALSLALLIRFAAVTEARYHVNSLSKEIEQLENQRENLRVEVERSSKSRWIEDEARERLGMQYPQPHQMIYINVNPAEVALVESRIHDANEETNNIEDANNIFNRTLSRVTSFFKI